MALADLIQSTAAVLDLNSGSLLEMSAYYPNGARETYLVDASAAMAPEPMGFTGKEGDEAVGLVYFGERYLSAHLGRWISVDPLEVHGLQGGQALNSFHYLAGSALQGRDPLGLRLDFELARADNSMTSAQNQRRLRETSEVAGIMASHARELFGIDAVRTEERSGGELRRVSLTMGSPAFACSTQEARDLYQTARSRVESMLRAENPGDDSAVRQGLADWETARNRLLRYLDPRRSVVVEVSDQSADRGGGPMNSQAYNGSVFRMNPAGLLASYNDPRTTEGARVSLGPLMLFLHETDHKDGCLFGDPARCIMPNGAVQDDQLLWELPTVNDIDRVRRATPMPGAPRSLPERLDYPTIPPGGVERIEGNEVRGHPTRGQARHDRP